MDPQGEGSVWILKVRVACMGPQGEGSAWILKVRVVYGSSR